ncbi:MAG: alkaline phosphatase [Candidatus Aminicenantes bacterium]|jgi:alkaline phosphatase
MRAKTKRLYPILSVLGIGLVLVFFNCCKREQTAKEPEHAKDVFLFKGDGMGLASLSEAEKEELRIQSNNGDKEALRRMKLALTVAEIRKLGESLTDLNDQNFYFALTHLLNEKAFIGWSSDVHTAIPVPVYALGVQEELFNGYCHNTDIAKKIASIMDIPGID